MSKEEPKEMGNVNWDALERAEKEKKRKLKTTDNYDKSAVEEEKKLLSEEEKNMPYPDDFLADINLLNKSIKPNRPQSSTKDDEEEPTN